LLATEDVADVFWDLQLTRDRAEVTIGG
jgi:hypothetical protein